MTPDRWEQINQLYHAALEVEEKERSLFLRKACGNDTELRHEVESLLSMHEHVGGFLAEPAMAEVAETMKVEPASLLGRHLGPYQIQGVLGAGGMGEVYKARDTRLNRTVAIKVLPKHLSERTDLRQRFEREARAIASLDHPHICALYDVGREGETDYLVMQYLEGQTLSQRLRQGALPTKEVLRYSIEIAGALEAAHRRGVIHRDLKPGNIMLTESGAKLLDFGLAKQNRSPLPRGDSGGVEPATQNDSLTQEGMLLGTLDYMAPEQLEGKEADGRTDIFALGVIIYEMATGRKAFQADSKASLIAKILTSQPPAMATIEPVTPPELERVVQKCLAKKPEERWQSAAEVTSKLHGISEIVLGGLKAGKAEAEQCAKAIQKAVPPVPAPVLELQKGLPRLLRSRAWQLSLVGLLLAVTTGFLALWRLQQQPLKPPERKEMSFRPLTSNAWDNVIVCAAISPDGTYLAFFVKELFVQVIRTGEKHPLPLPQGFDIAGVEWFPDGTKLLLHRAQERWVQVKQQSTRQPDLSIWSLSMLGGKPQLIVDHADSASISPDGSLLAIHRFDPDRQASDIWLVGSNGEGLHKLKITSHAGGPGAGASFMGPVWSPNGQRILYRRIDDHVQSIESCDLRGEQVTTFLSPANDLGTPSWTRDGRIIQVLREKERVPFKVNENLWETKIDGLTGRPLSEARRLTRWSEGISAQSVSSPSVTADGKRLVVIKWNGQKDVYLAELEPGGKSMKTPRRLTLVETDDLVSDWTADSRSILFDSVRNGNWDIFKQDINQTDAEPVVATPMQEWRPNLSPDRAFVLYLVSEKQEQRVATRLMRIPVGGGPPERVLSGEKITDFSCARDAHLCVLAEEVEGKQVLTEFDPLKGRGEKLPMSHYSEESALLSPQGRLVLSPQGHLVEKFKAGPDGLHIRVRSLSEGTVEEVAFKKLIGEYRFHGWSFDGRGIYIADSSQATLLYAGLDGHSTILWKRGSSPGLVISLPVPSPDGRYLAFTVDTYESNVWMLENF